MAQGNGTSRAGLWLSIATSVVLLFGAIGSIFYIGFKVQTTADIQEQRGRRIDILEQKISLLQDRISRIEVAQNEIETQFCGVSRDTNRTHANDLRLFAVIWKKIFDADYPIGNAYYPEYGKCNSSK